MIKNNLINEIIAATGNKLASTADESKILNDKYSFNTDIPALNIALSGDIDGTVNSGLLMIAGPSKHFKTCYMLKICSSYLEKNPDGLMVLFDSEGGSSINYLKTFGIPMEKVVHIPVSNIEELKTQHLRVLKKLNRGDKVIFAVDSIGNLASLKETDDAEEGKNVADMTRAKQLKSYGRIITPELTNKDLFMIAVNHTYKTMEMYSKDVVGGGCVIAGTKVITEDGIKNIEDILPSDKVLTHIGYQAVTHVWNPETLDEGYPDCYRVTFEDGSQIVCSENHRFLTQNGEWLYVIVAKEGDEVITIN